MSPLCHLLVVLSFCLLALHTEALRPHRRPVDERKKGPSSDTLWDLIKSNSKLTKLTVAIKKTGFDEILDGEDPKLTMFAPDDEAIVGMRHEQTGEELFCSGHYLEIVHSILQYHVIEDTIKLGDLKDGEAIETLQGSEVKVFVRKIADNATISSIEYANIKKADMEASNGVLHIIDKVLLPNHYTINRTMDDFKNRTLAEVLEKSASLSKLHKLMKLTGLIDDLDKSDKEWTLFAPVDWAWYGEYRKLLMSGDKKTIKTVLQYHLLDKYVFSHDLAEGDDVKTENGQKLHVSRKSVSSILRDLLLVDNAIMTRQDYVAKNGVIHILDRVMLPAK
jgi:uncharacterized surface protein with fasciclin (FAS1) repeats